MGDVPGDAHPDREKCFGVFKVRVGLVNGLPSFVKAASSNEESDVFMWSANVQPDQRGWFVSPRKDRIGTTRAAFYVLDDAQHPDQIKAMWKVPNSDKNWTSAPNLKVINSATVEKLDQWLNEVSVTGERTREEKDAEGRKHAIELDGLDPPKRARTVSRELEDRVVKARSIYTKAIHDKTIDLLKPAIDQWASDKIDDAELKQRKIDAQKDAEAEHEPALAPLEAAYESHTADVAERVRAEERMESAVAAEDKSNAALQAAVRALLPDEGGPSGVKRD